jgi:hypothetical protein
MNVNCLCPKFGQKAQATDMQLIKCQTCSAILHKACVGIEVPKTKRYNCPSCQIKLSDPYLKHINYLLVPNKIENKRQNNQYSFNFIVDPVIFRDGNNNKNRFIQIRCLRLDEKAAYEHHWPYNCKIILNSNQICEPDKIPSGQNRSKERVDFPIVFYLNDSANNAHGFHNKHYFNNDKLLHIDTPNRLEIICNFADNLKDMSHYVIAVSLVEVRTLEDVLQYIPLYDKEKVKGIIYGSDEAITNGTIIMTDCYNQNPITLPGRSLNCMHLTVFDIRNFLIMRRNKVYNCPFCKKKCDSLYIDQEIYNFIEKNKDVTSITIDKDYNIQIPRTKEEIVVSKANDKAIDNINNIERVSKVRLNQIDLTEEDGMTVVQAVEPIGSDLFSRSGYRELARRLERDKSVNTEFENYFKKILRPMMKNYDSFEFLGKKKLRKIN